jgi:hypothetical protein
MSAYSPHEHRPLAAYAGLAAAFGGAFGGALVALRASGRELPERPAAGDIALLGVATHKVSRLLAKDKVTSFLRAPFTRYEQSTGQGEVLEEARGRGLQLAIGELAVCPYCIAQWVVAGLGVAYVAAPRQTRLVSSVFTAKSLADFVQLAYLAAEERAG